MEEWLRDWNNLGPVVSILVSFLGFTVAIVQIRRTTTAVDAAKVAVESTKETFIKNQVLATLVRSIERAQEMRILYSEEHWDRAYYRYNDVWTMLTTIGAQHPNLTSTQRDAIDELVAQLQENERLLEKAVRSKKSPQKIQEHVKVFQKLQSTLGELSTSLQ